MNNNKIAVIGECMIEVRPAKTGDVYRGQTIHSEVSYGGDTLNCAVYLARQGITVEYVTMLGDDPMSDWMLHQWQLEGVGCGMVCRESGSVPGLYLIDVDTSGERSFFYWRSDSPARRLFDDGKQAKRLFEQLAEFRSLYLSGITLSLYNEPTRQALFQFFDSYRKLGGRICFDNNFRPRQWPDMDSAKFAFEAMYRLTDIALPTLDDEQRLFDDEDENAMIARLRSWGVAEIVIKKGANGCAVAKDNEIVAVKGNPVSNVVDTTSAGDSFNAGFLAARINGSSLYEAARNGNLIASVVVQHRGAIIPQSAMPNGPPRS